MNVNEQAHIASMDAENAARAAAGDAVRYAAWDAASGAAWNAARDAAWDAAREAENVTGNADTRIKEAIERAINER